MLKNSDQELFIKSQEVFIESLLKDMKSLITDLIPPSEKNKLTSGKKLTSWGHIYLFSWGCLFETLKFFLENQFINEDKYRITLKDFKTVKELTRLIVIKYTIWDEMHFFQDLFGLTQHYSWSNIQFSSGNFKSSCFLFSFIVFTKFFFLI